MIILVLSLKTFGLLHAMYTNYNRKDEHLLVKKTKMEPYKIQIMATYAL